MVALKGGCCGGTESAHSTGFLLGGDDRILKWTVVRAAQLREYTKNHGVIYSKWGSCMVGEL